MANDSPWGMVLHYSEPNLINILNRGNVKWLRTETNFKYQQFPGQRPSQYAAWGATNQIVNAAAANGQSLYFGLQPHYPEWILKGRPRLPGLPQPTPEERDAWNRRFEHWGNFVRLVLAELVPRGVTHYNIGNEPNDPNFYPHGAQDYVRALVVAADVIHAAGCKVIAPDVATLPQHNPWDFLRLCLNGLRGSGQYLDAVSIHGYPSGDDLPRLLRQLSGVYPVLREYGVTSPVWLTETGVDKNQAITGSRKGAMVKEICSWVGEGTMLVPDVPPRRVPQFRKVFFYIWSEDSVPGSKDNGKYAWLHWPDFVLNDPKLLEPIPYLWNAYRSVTGGS